MTTNISAKEMKREDERLDALVMIMRELVARVGILNVQKRLRPDTERL